MSLKLYGFGHSRSFRCLWALCESKIQFDYRDVQLGETEGSRSPDFLVKNAQGKVPTIDHNGFILTESAAILNYIDTLSEGNCIPTESSLRAKYDELCYFTLCELEQPLWTTGKHRFAIPEEYRVADIFKTAVWEFEKAINALEHLLIPGEFALGKHFSFADILLAHTIKWAYSFKFYVPDHLLVYSKAMYQRAAAKEASNIIAELNPPE